MPKSEKIDILSEFFLAPAIVGGDPPAHDFEPAARIRQTEMVRFVASRTKPDEPHKALHAATVLLRIFWQGLVIFPQLMTFEIST